jgi:hypothetical protein
VVVFVVVGVFCGFGGGGGGGGGGGSTGFRVLDTYRPSGG